MSKHVYIELCSQYKREQACKKAGNGLARREPARMQPSMVWGDVKDMHDGSVMWQEHARAYREVPALEHGVCKQVRMCQPFDWSMVSDGVLQNVRKRRRWRRRVTKSV
jgi:hypothetical protein